MSVYFIRGGDAVKIGKARDARQRMRELQVGHPVDLELLREIPGSGRTERWLHDHFAHLAIRGEWFRFDETMLSVVPPDEEISPIGRRVPEVAPANAKASVRLAIALRKRLRPWSLQSSLTVKEVCAAIRVSDDSLLNWASGRVTPHFDLAGDLVAFFWARGDKTFLAEVFGVEAKAAGLVSPLVEARAALDSIIEREVA